MVHVAEQVRGQDLDHRSDIFSFGIILYEMLSGQRSVHGRLRKSRMMNAILNEDPPELSETNAKINPALEQIVRRCLEKKPELRFQSAQRSGLCVGHADDTRQARAQERRRPCLR